MTKTVEAAIGGYSPVSYFEKGQAEPGIPEFHAEHEGKTYSFTSAAQVTTFQANPNLWLLLSGLTCVLNLPLTSDDRARCHFRGADFARVRVPRLTGVYPRASNVAELAALLCSGPTSVQSAGVTSVPSPFPHARHPMLRRLRTQCAEPHLRSGAAGTRTLINIYNDPIVS